MDWDGECKGSPLSYLCIFGKMKNYNSKKIVMLGPPGAGKGTQAELLAKKLDIVHLDAGDILREEISKGTDLGEEAKKYVDGGELVPDKLIGDIMVGRIKDNQEGYVLDGFPRTLKQAEILSSFDDVDVVVNIKLGKTTGVKRLSARRICKNCGKTYNLVYNPPQKEGICDECGHKLYQRSDDKKGVIKNRFEVYERRTAPLKEYYSDRGKLVVIDGDRSIEKIHEDILERLN